MPSPITPGQIENTVPSASAPMCDKIKAVLLELPALLRDFFDWFLNDDGSISDEAANEINAKLYQPGDLKLSASSVVTDGWLLCQGQAVLRTAYAALFSKIGTTFGAGDGSTTFNLPNPTERLIMIAGGAFPLASSGGADEVTLEEANLPAHVHQVAYGVTSEGTGANIQNDVPISSGHDEGRTDTTSTGGSPPTAVPILNPYMAFNLLIKT